VPFFAELITAGKIKELNSIYKVEYHLLKGDYEACKECFKTASPSIRDFLYTSHRKAILGFIKAKKDMEFLEMIKDKITFEDIDTFSSEAELLYRLIETKDRRIEELFLDWFYKREEKSPFYPLLFSSYNLWRLYLQRIRESRNIDFLLETVKLFKVYHSEQFEEVLLDEVMELLEQFKKDKRLSRDFAQALDSLPIPESLEINILRTFIKYKLSGELLLLRQLSSLAGERSLSLSDRYQTMIFDAILEDILKASKPEEMSEHLNFLFEKSQDKQGYLIRVLEIAERVKIPGNTKKTLEAMLTEFLKALSSDKGTEEIKRRMDMVFKEKPPFWKRLLGKRNKD